MMTAEEQLKEVHEHPLFNGQYHDAVWVQTWVTGDANDIEAPEGTPITCAICGKAKPNS